MFETPDENPLEQLERRQAEAMARELLDAELDETERRAMILHYRDELPLAVVTKLLGLTNASGAGQAGAAVGEPGSPVGDSDLFTEHDDASNLERGRRIAGSGRPQSQRDGDERPRPSL